MKDFASIYGGMLWAIRDWAQWDALVAKLQAEADDAWFVYFVGQDLPTAPLPAETFRRVLAEIDILLHHDHRERYLGIVYVDDREHPNLLKIYDPNNLGASCGSSGKLIPPGWVLSRMPPEHLPGPVIIPEGRLRWWRELFDGQRGA
ncbi:hypothetical protein [Acidithiobacillus sp. AMEEHan]|uniref:hypothetical protein n=1 Tax=Acidithiobacillus sp. AMEEHan TaxID=2994951 RepID=UPI0027E579E6|nr:hypothetical protein [Acidithiobacillus sp. AMEEHan]